MSSKKNIDSNTDPITTDFGVFPWNHNDMVVKCYQSNNFKIIYTGSNNNRAVVFFSSNGIYYPNTEREFKTFLKCDKYEWVMLSKQKCIRQHFQKIVFVRDIYKQWYVTGINSEINSIEKLFDFLQEELEGYNVTTCGSSSGGYMAALMGAMLNAERIIDNCGQFDLNLLSTGNPFIEFFKGNPSKNRYYQVKEFIESCCDRIYYFYPSKSKIDLVQKKCIEDIDVKIFAVDGETHGKTIYSICFPFLLTMDDDVINGIFEKYKNRVIKKDEWFKSIVPIKQRMVYKIVSLLKR